jgi:predicted GNAT superfamily acetyltransferase
MDKDTITIRELKEDRELFECIRLQGEIWGLEEAGRTSPIEMKVFSMDNPKMGILLGAFDGEKMIGFCIIIPTREPGCLYGHMIGIVPGYRDSNVGYRIHSRLFEVCREQEIRRLKWTYEPLEGRNANLYINKTGVKVIAYKKDCFVVHDDMNGGMPIDRFLVELDFADPAVQEILQGNRPQRQLHAALERYPVAGESHFPGEPGVLIQIPPDLQALKEQNMASAVALRYATRKIFDEYINRRGYVIRSFYTGLTGGERESYYLMERVPE